MIMIALKLDFIILLVEFKMNSPYIFKRKSIRNNKRYSFFVNNNIITNLIIKI